MNTGRSRSNTPGDIVGSTPIPTIYFHDDNSDGEEIIPITSIPEETAKILPHKHEIQFNALTDLLKQPELSNLSESAAKITASYLVNYALFLDPCDLQINIYNNRDELSFFSQDGKLLFNEICKIAEKNFQSENPRFLKALHDIHLMSQDVNQFTLDALKKTLQTFLVDFHFEIINKSNYRGAVPKEEKQPEGFVINLSTPRNDQLVNSDINVDHIEELYHAIQKILSAQVAPEHADMPLTNIISEYINLRDNYDNLQKVFRDKIQQISKLMHTEMRNTSRPSSQSDVNRLTQIDQYFLTSRSIVDHCQNELDKLIDVAKLAEDSEEKQKFLSSAKKCKEILTAFLDDFLRNPVDQEKRRDFSAFIKLKKKHSSFEEKTENPQQILRIEDFEKEFSSREAVLSELIRLAYKNKMRPFEKKYNKTHKEDPINITTVIHDICERLKQHYEVVKAKNEQSIAIENVEPVNYQNRERSVSSSANHPSMQRSTTFTIFRRQTVAVHNEKRTDNKKAENRTNPSSPEVSKNSLSRTSLVKKVTDFFKGRRSSFSNNNNTDNNNNINNNQKGAMVG